VAKRDKLKVGDLTEIANDLDNRVARLREELAVTERDSERCYAVLTYLSEHNWSHTVALSPAIKSALANAAVKEGRSRS
jgi:hypothetical protein